MGIYIKGMEMPKDCTECTLNYLDNFGYPHCGVTRLVIVEGKIKGDCPLTEVPEPHGRLIDGDRVVSNIPSDEAPFCKYLIAKAVASVPTVIEGSE